MIRELTNRFEGLENVTCIINAEDGIDIFYDILDETETRVDDELIAFVEDLEESTGLIAISIFDKEIIIEDALTDDCSLGLFENDIIIVEEEAVEDCELEELKKNNEFVVVISDEEEIILANECQCCICEEPCEDMECTCDGLDNECCQGYADIDASGITINNGMIKLSSEVITPEWIIECDEYITSEIAFHSIANGIKILSNTGVSIDDAVYHARDIVQEIMNK